MKTISQHLGQIILAVAAVALIIGVVLTFATPVHNFMDGVLDKLYEVGNGPIWNVGATSGEKLDIPTNLVLDGATLTFDPVENADQYLLSVNGGAAVAHTTNSIDVSTYLAALEPPVEFKVVASDSTGVYGNSDPAIYTYAGLEPGLYDADDNLIASWDVLVNTYGMDCTINYSAYDWDTSAPYHETTTTSPYYVLTNTPELANGVKMIIGDSVTTIGCYAFYGCASLQSIVLPNSLESTGNIWTVGLVYNEYDNGLYLGSKENPYMALMQLKDYNYSPADLILHNETKIISCALFQYNETLTSYEVPASVTTLYSHTFQGCINLEYLTPAEGSQLKIIGPQTFQYCSNLTSITLPATITTIDSQAFSNCTSLTNINFEGTIEQWNAITLGTDWNSGIPATVVTCSNGTVSLK